MKKTRYYILFPSHTDAIRMEELLKNEKIGYTIVPTPREISLCCGISIMYNKCDEEKIKELIDLNKINTSGLHSIVHEFKNPYL
ncbi:DUF3343 domain-containing protein [Clostridium fermenticellae]|uniref:DUF3343 domain-containing protein n=1 Tax=Clostridium fermenticellae TaxID=2068654 RepID=A0A386H1X4_9CLOT|nr:DUF3343 domain-containing protein [Clostridium fermenticellae]AYD39699.1 DUF3343 domain-containing protein [Clostridium fermenticellae]